MSEVVNRELIIRKLGMNEAEMLELIMRELEIDEAEMRELEIDEDFIRKSVMLFVELESSMDQEELRDEILFKAELEELEECLRATLKAIRKDAVLSEMDQEELRDEILFGAALSESEKHELEECMRTTLKAIRKDAALSESEKHELEEFLRKVRYGDAAIGEAEKHELEEFRQATPKSNKCHILRRYNELKLADPSEWALEWDGGSVPLRQWSNFLWSLLRHPERKREIVGLWNKNDDIEITPRFVRECIASTHGKALIDTAIYPCLKNKDIIL